MVAFLIVFRTIGNILAPIVAQMGWMLLSERVVRRVAVISVRWLESKTPNQSVKDALEVIAKAWDVPELAYKKGE